MLDDWYLKIIRVSDGYILEERNPEYSYQENPEAVEYIRSVVADNELDELASGQELLWRVMDYFALRGDRYDKERLQIIRERGDKYEGDKA